MWYKLEILDYEITKYNDASSKAQKSLQSCSKVLRTVPLIAHLKSITQSTQISYKSPTNDLKILYDRDEKCF